MGRIIKAKHWQIFIILMISLILSNFKIENQEIINSILSISGAAFLFVYILSVGHYLQDYIPDRIDLNDNFFIVNSCIWIIAFSFIMITSNGEGKSYEGIAALPMFYVFFAFLHSIAFMARTLKSIELGRKASFGDYIGGFFLIVFLPIGIWFLQPRINQIVERKAVIKK